MRRAIRGVPGSTRASRQFQRNHPSNGNSLLTLDYPNFEVIVVNNGSTDSTTAIAHEYGFRVISTENRGLSHARNMGLDAATGEIVAYIDDDAYPDRHWLSYLGSMFMTTSHAGSAGPMFLPAGMGASRSASPTPPAARSTSCLPIRKRSTSPAVNMAFRRSCRQATGGFDPQFRRAGDDVDSPQSRALR